MNNHENKKSGEKLTAIMLIVVFSLPFFGAWVIYSYTDFGSGGDVSSHGRLIMPPGQVTDMTPADPSNSGGNYKLHGKWNLVYQTTGSCESECERSLEIMRGARAVLGNDAARLQLILVVAGPYLDERLRSILTDKRILTSATIEITGLNNREDIVGGDEIMKNTLFLIDPLGNLMMQYSSESTLAGVIKDIKRLLHNSRIG